MTPLAMKKPGVTMYMMPILVIGGGQPAQDAV
jgi:hypothetical protein